MNRKLITALLILATCFTGYAAEEKIKIQSNDNQIFEISKKTFSDYSQTLRNMFEDVPENDKGTPIPFPNINGATLEIIILCINNSDAAEKILLSLNSKQLEDVTGAISYLDMQHLFTQLPQVKWISSLISDTQNIITLFVHSDAITSVAISPDSTCIVTGLWGGTAKIWDAKSGTCLNTLKGHSGNIYSVAISPDNAFIVTDSFNDNKAKIWDSKTGKCLHTLEEHSDITFSAAISPDGVFIVTNSCDNTAKIWDSKSGTCLKNLVGHSDTITSVAISPDSAFIVTGSYDRTAKIWDTKSGTCLNTLKGHSGNIRSVAISPDSAFIVTGSMDNTAKIWDSKNGTSLKNLEGHSNYIRTVAISPDGAFIVTGSWDGTAKIWDTNGTCLKTIEGCSHGFISPVAISPNNTFIVTNSCNKTVKFWPLYTSEQLDSLYLYQLILITEIYETKDGKKLSLNTDQLKSYKSLSAILKNILNRYVVIPQR